MLCHGRAQNILYFQEFEFLIIVDAYLEVILVTKKGSLYNFSYNLRCWNEFFTSSSSMYWETTMMNHLFKLGLNDHPALLELSLVCM